MTKRVDKYILSDIIGKGNFAIVQKATHQTRNGQFAVKVISNATILSNPKLQECLINEVEALSKVQNCEYIIKYYQMIRTKNNFYFVYEYCNGGNLHQHLTKYGSLTEKQALAIFRQILQAFKVLNKLNVMHRDLKPQNIFLHNGKAKLGDFGFCKALKYQQNMAKTMLGSPLYMAPQVLKGQLYSVKADIWSLGAIVYQMIYGFCPYESASIAMLVSKISNVQLNFPDKEGGVSQRTKNLIKKMLNKDYIVRSSWVQLFNQGIDFQGNYISQKQEPLKQFNSLRKLRESSPRHPSLNKRDSIAEVEPQNKQNKVKSFYSQRYMNLLSIPQNNCEKLATPNLRSSVKKPSIFQFVSQKEYQTPINNQNQQKQDIKKIALKKYLQCSEIIFLMELELHKNNVQICGYSINVLNKVYSVLKNICQLLNKYPNQFLQFINTLKFQMIHINQSISAARAEIKKLGCSLNINDQSLNIDVRIANFVNRVDYGDKSN